MPVKSAGVLAFRTKGHRLEVLLVHPGGPFWRNKDLGAWSIPKGEYGPDEEAEQVARREFREELGVELTGPLSPLGDIRQRGGKVVTAFGAARNIDAAAITSSTFEIEWPPRSGRRQAFPEIDRAEWFELAAARTRINEAQTSLLDQLETIVAGCAKR